MTFYETDNIDGVVKSREMPLFVIPAEAGHVVELFALSSHFNSFWTPDFAGVTDLGLFITPSSFAPIIYSKALISEELIRI